MNDVLVLIESNTSGTGRLFFDSAVKLGLRPVLLSADPSRYPFADLLPEVEVVDTASRDAVVSACRRLWLRGARLCGVLTSSDHYVPMAAAVAGWFGLPGNPPGAVTAARDKAAQRAILAGAGVPQPRFEQAATADEAMVLAAGIGLPVVVKPVTGSGSHGVRLCRTGEEVARHAGRLLTMTRNERGLPVPCRVLVEEHVTGPEYSVELLNGHVVGLTRKHLGRPPLFVEIGHDFPADLPAPVADGLSSTASAAVRNLDLTTGPAHVELRLGPSGPRLIEVNPRLAGGWIPRLVHEAIGVDLITETVRGAAGGTPRIRPEASGAAAIRFLLMERAGVLKGFTGLERARQVPEVTEVSLYRELGSALCPAGDFRDRIGHVMTREAHIRRAAGAAEEAARLIRPVIDGEEEDGGR
ncbi:ATP-grasp domain-containing protein [Streptosporangium sp. NPDC001681]|uniref:ATP-grasp domain-containing protein n=1 Tax=Streptosporangium sp. NPDC001681 TaxID=3154395 RepID=UPI0033169218